MKAKDILATKGSQVVTIQEDNLLVEATELFFSKRIGSLLVTDKDRNIHGIIAPNDVLRALFHNPQAIPTMKVGDVMTRDVIVATPDDKIDYLLAIMTENRIRHIPIIDGGKLAGMISTGDVVKAQIIDEKVENRYLKDYIEGKYPA
jgi:predicted transcriptional regulator